MLKIFSTGVVLAIISTTVLSDKNVTKELTNINKYVTEDLSNSDNYDYITIELPSSNINLTKELLLILNKTLSEDANSIVKISLDTYVDPDVDKVWKMYLLEKINRFKEKLRMTTAMRKENAVTESIKTIIERGANKSIEKEATSNHNITLKTKAFAIRTDDSVVHNTSTKGYKDVSNTERANMSNVLKTNSIVNEDPYNDDNVLELVPFINASASVVNDTSTKGYKDVSNTERANMSNVIKTNSIVNEDPYNDDNVLELVPFINASASAVNDTGHKSSRRQKTKLTKQGKLLLKMAEFAGKGRLKFERYREPYWKFGDYVFLRTGSPTTPFNYTGKWKFGQEKPTINPMEVFRDCDRVCSHYYKAYGLICAHRLISRYWRNEYKNFDNICDMDHENCVNPISRPHWHPIYKGVCGELGEFAQPPYDYKWIVHHAKTWEPFVYVPPTPTDPTADPLDEELKKALLETQSDAAKAKEG